MSKTKKKKSPKTAKKTPVRSKFEYYQDAVQSPVDDLALVERIFRKRYDRKPLQLREDFCGTAHMSATWVSGGKERTAVGVDICKDTLAWGRKHNIEPLGETARRVTLLNRNVLDPGPTKIDVIASLNFSYFVLKQRQTLLAYFKKARASLRKQGCLVMDHYGGPDAMAVSTERRRCKGFTYIWDQAEYWPITGETRCFIHFEPKNGKKLNKAFEYDWRLWNLPELQDLLREAGFKHVEVYWEGSTKNGHGNGIFTRRDKGDADACWIAYIAAFTS